MARRRRPPMANASGPSALVTRWRAEAEVLRRRGAEPLAVGLESCAAELEQWAKEHALEALTLEQAVAESGYSYSALQHMVAEGKIKNAAKPGHRPRIRRADLPRKVQTSASAPVVQLADRVLRARQRGAS